MPSSPKKASKLAQRVAYRADIAASHSLGTGFAFTSIVKADHFQINPSTVTMYLGGTSSSAASSSSSVDTLNDGRISRVTYLSKC